VSITSLNARLAAPGMSAYCSAKAGLAMLTQVAALEFARNKIRVNAVSPGFVTTPLTELVTQVPAVLADYLENTPLGRVGTPEDVANAVLFLCSDKASWMTGEVLDLNGGAHLKRYPDVLGHIERMGSEA
jgi:NAD(P)-dependent dehydrogenase (short-subunit alcohol dehydrogenase family)